MLRNRNDVQTWILMNALRRFLMALGFDGIRDAAMQLSLATLVLACLYIATCIVFLL